MAKAVSIVCDDGGAAADEIDATVPTIDAVTHLTNLRPPWPRLCPLPEHHHDRQSSPGFYVYPGTQGWYCYGCGEVGKVIRLLKLMRGMSTEDAVEYARKTWLRGESAPGMAAAIQMMDAPKENRVAQLSTAKLTEELETRTTPCSIDAAKYLVRMWKLPIPPEKFKYLLHAWGVRWCASEVRFWYPVRDINGTMVDVRRRSETKKPKVKSLPGYGIGGALFGAHRLNREPDKLVVVVGGEKDAVVGSGMLGAQYLFVSSTRGENGWSEDTMSEPLRGRRVVVFLDNDAAGKRATKRALDKLYRYVVELKRVTWTCKEKDLTELVAARKTRLARRMIRDAWTVKRDVLAGGTCSSE